MDNIQHVSAFDLRRSMRRLSMINVSTFEDDQCVALSPARLRLHSKLTYVTSVWNVIIGFLAI